jgi:hypothetical protein
VASERSELAYVFGYASLVAVPEPGAVPGRLRGYRRFWGAAMNNWEGGERVKHWLDRDSGGRPCIRVAYLDIEPSEGSAVNGVAIPVDAERLTAFDAREVNYERVDVTDAFLGPASGRVFTYVGLDAARERCRQGAAKENVYVSRDYAAGVRLAFERLGDEALAEFERTTEPLPFPERDLQVVLPPSGTGS